MTRWEDLFEVCRKDSKDLWLDPDRYIIRNKLTQEIVGEYEDESYAKKQARYRFKKLQKSIERSLLK